VLNKERLEAFVELNKGELLAALGADDVQTTAASDAEAIATYLSSISSAHNDKIVNVSNDDIEAALGAQLQLNPSLMDTVVASLTNNITELTTVAAPAEVQQLHTTLLQASIALRDNVVTLRAIDDDFVAGLIASRNIDELGGVFQKIADQVVELEIKYELE